MSKGDPQELITGGTDESCPADGDGDTGVGGAMGVSRQKALGKNKDPDPIKTERCPVLDTGRSVVYACYVYPQKEVCTPHPLGLQISGPVYPSASNQRHGIWKPGIDMTISTSGPSS